MVLVAGACALAIARDRRARWLVAPALLGLASLAMSLRLEPYEVLPSAFRMVQFPYRLVTYVNLAALAGVLLAVRLAGERGFAVRSGVLLAAVGLSLFSLGLKLYRSCDSYECVPVDFRHVPHTFTGWDAYTTNALYPRLPMTREEEAKHTVRVRMEVAPVGRPKYQPLRLSLNEPKVVIVQVRPFPWNVLEVNGARRPGGLGVRLVRPVRRPAGPGLETAALPRRPRDAR